MFNAISEEAARYPARCALRWARRFEGGRRDIAHGRSCTSTDAARQYSPELLVETPDQGGEWL